jgi:hypothetical protein
MTRKNVIRIVFQNSKSKKCSCSKDQKRRCSRGFAPVAKALYTQGSGIPVLPMNRRCPRPHRGQGWRKGGGGRSIQQEISRQNMTIPSLNSTMLISHTQCPNLTRVRFSSAGWLPKNATAPEQVLHHHPAMQWGIKGTVTFPLR